MKNKVKICSLMLIGFFGLINGANASNVYTNYNGVEMSTNEFNNLISMGFTDEQIYNMEQDEFEKNKNLSGEIVATDTIYVKTINTYAPKDENLNIMAFAKSEIINDINNGNNYELVSTQNIIITEEEFNNVDENNDNVIIVNDVNPDIISTEYKKLTTNIIKNGSTYRVKNDLTWKKMPSTRSNDLFGIRINHSIAEPKSGSQYAKTTYKMKDACTLQTTTYNTVHSSNWNRAETGYGVAFKIPSDTTKRYIWYKEADYPCADKDSLYKVPATGNKLVDVDVTSLNSYMYFDLVKLSNGALSAFGSYQHAQKSVSLSSALTFTFGSGGLGGVFNLSASISEKYDGMDGTHAQILNPNW